MEASLSILDGLLAGQTIPLHVGKLLIGREEDCQLRLDSEFVSRHHCALLLDDYTVRVRDLGSRNGTFVNGRRIGPGQTILLHGDVLSIDNNTFRVDLDAPPPKESTTALDQTGVIDGETLPTTGPGVVPTLPTPPSRIPTPVIADALPLIPDEVD